MSTTPSVLNAALSSIGGSGSGFDVTATVTAIITADRTPEVAWQAQQATLAKQTAAISQIQTEAASLSDQLFALQDPLGALTYVSATSSDTTKLTASAAAGTASGTHVVAVTALAATDSWFSSSVASSSTQLGSNSFSLTADGVQLRSRPAVVLIRWTNSQARLMPRVLASPRAWSRIQPVPGSPWSLRPPVQQQPFQSPDKVA